MNEQIREEIQRIEAGASNLKSLAEGNPSVLRNAEIILSFVYILKFITPNTDKEA